MGGTLGVTIRTEDKQEHRMMRWTNSFPSFVNSAKFIDGDEDHVRQYLKTWYDMVDAYNSGNTKDSPMADVYVPDAGLYPSEYGLVIIDYPSRTLLSSQSYTDVGSILASSVGLALMENKPVPAQFRKFQRPPSEVKEELDELRALFDQKVISYQRLSYEEPEKVKLTLEQFADQWNEKNRYEYAMLDMSPWNVLKYEERDIVQMKAKVLELGFVINEQEERGWKEFIERYEE